jgi:hypothetical protein
MASVFSALPRLTVLCPVVGQPCTDLTASLGLIDAIYKFELIPKETNFESLFQGVIANLKHKFKKMLIQRLLTEIDVNKNASWQPNILDACHMLATSWNAVEDKTIANCFRKAGFTAARQLSHATDVSEIVDASEGWEIEDELPLWNLVRDRLGLPAEITFADYSNIDSELATCEIISADELLNQFSAENWDAAQQEESENEEEPEAETEPAMPSTSDAIVAVETLRRYFGGLEATKTEDFEKISGIETSILSAAVKKQKQKAITDFFCTVAKN